MAVETYKYFVPDTFLRADYGGAAIQNGGDSAEIAAYTLTQRYICRQLGLPANKTHYLFKIGTAAGVTYIRVSDNIYTTISAYLSAAELATVVSSAPVGFTLSSNTIQLQPSSKRTNLILRGDSISAGLGTTTGDTRDVFISQAIESISGEVLFSLDVAHRERISDNYKVVNIALGGSSWANTNVSGETTYPYREDLAYAQRTQTMPLDGGAANNIFTYWLGTNDLAYESTLSGSDAWDRAASQIAELRTEFPALPIIICTAMKRSELAALNDRIDDYNVLMRANYLTAGASVLCDFEANVPEVNISTGDTTDTTYYTDGTHITTVTHGLLAPVFKTAFLSLL